MTLSAGTKLGRYEIRSKIGAGGMGQVYLARDTSELDRTVAIFKLWQNADSDLPVLIEAKREYAKLK